MVLAERFGDLMDKLAIFGGVPVREMPLSYGRQYIDEEDIQAVADVLRSDFLTCGPQIGILEQKLCEVTGARYAVAVSNGTAALHVAAMAAGIGKGDEVIVSSITFAASANCIVYCQGTPVFADIDSETYNISPDSIEKCITSRTKAVIAVDFTGQAAELDRIREICEKHKLLLIEDAAHAIGTRYCGKPIGSIANMTCFSFHPVKTVTSGEGGAVTTNDKSLYEKLLLFRQHGITHESAQMEHPSDAAWYYEQITLGYNYRMTDLQAALLCSQLNKLPAFSKRRKEIADRYDKAFRPVPEIQLQKNNPHSDTTRHLYILRLRLNMLTCTRREFFDALKAENIRSQVHYLPVYYHPYYEKAGYVKGLCPNAEAFYEEVMSLPLYYGLKDEDVADVIRAVEKIIAYYRK